MSVTVTDEFPQRVPLYLDQREVMWLENLIANGAQNVYEHCVYSEIKEVDALRRRISNLNEVYARLNAAKTYLKATNAIQTDTP